MRKASRPQEPKPIMIGILESIQALNDGRLPNKSRNAFRTMIIYTIGYGFGLFFLAILVGYFRAKGHI